MATKAMPTYENFSITTSTPPTQPPPPPPPPAPPAPSLPNSVNSQINIGTNGLDSISSSQFDDEVQRYEADVYRQKYGDRWKKLASSVRDVVQPDGSIIREYVIDDPSLLEQLSEDDENQHQQLNLSDQMQQQFNNSTSYMSPNSNTTNQETIYQTSSTLNQIDQIKKEFSSSTHYNNINNQTNNYTNNNQNQTDSMNNLKSFATNSSYNLYLDKTSSITNLNANTNNNNNSNKNETNKYDKYFQPILPKNNSSSKSLNESTNNNNNKNVNKIKDEDEFDKEVEIIHEQGQQLREYEQYTMYSADGTKVIQANNINPVVEYEIVDEDGNQISINGAEYLKHLAASVKETVQADGSIIKEYLLNDPKIIQEIKNKVKSDTNDKIQQQQQQQQQNQSNDINYQTQIDNNLSYQKSSTITNTDIENIYNKSSYAESSSNINLNNKNLYTNESSTKLNGYTNTNSSNNNSSASYNQSTNNYTNINSNGIQSASSYNNINISKSQTNVTPQTKPPHQYPMTNGTLNQLIQNNNNNNNNNNSSSSSTNANINNNNNNLNKNIEQSYSLTSLSSLPDSLTNVNLNEANNNNRMNNVDNNYTYSKANYGTSASSSSPFLNPIQTQIQKFQKSNQLPPSSSQQMVSSSQQTAIPISSSLENKIDSFSNSNHSGLYSPNVQTHSDYNFELYYQQHQKLPELKEILKQPEQQQPTYQHQNQQHQQQQQQYKQSKSNDYENDYQFTKLKKLESDYERTFQNYHHDATNNQQKLLNKFELKTKRGKALQFMITSEDSTESDIEEIKEILNRTLDFNTLDYPTFTNNNSDKSLNTNRKLQQSKSDSSNPIYSPSTYNIYHKQSQYTPGGNNQDYMTAKDQYVFQPSSNGSHTSNYSNYNQLPPKPNTTNPAPTTTQSTSNNTNLIGSKAIYNQSNSDLKDSFASKYPSEQQSFTNQIKAIHQKQQQQQQQSNGINSPGAKNLNYLNFAKSLNMNTNDYFNSLEQKQSSYLTQQQNDAKILKYKNELYPNEKVNNNNNNKNNRSAPTPTLTNKYPNEKRQYFDESPLSHLNTNASIDSANSFLRRASSIGNIYNSPNSATNSMSSNGTTTNSNVIDSLAKINTKSAYQRQNSTDSYLANTNFNNNSNKKSAAKLFNGGTYTKSTMNLSYQSSESDFGVDTTSHNNNYDKYSNDYNYNKQAAASYKSHGTGYNPKSIKHSSALNRSVDNLDDVIMSSRAHNHNGNVTPEMTEQLLLKLLLQQMSTPTYKKLVSSSDYNSISNTTTLNGNKSTSNTGAALYSNMNSELMSLISPSMSSYPSSASSTSSKNNSIKNRLMQKSTNHLDVSSMDRIDSDRDQDRSRTGLSRPSKQSVPSTPYQLNATNNNNNNNNNININGNTTSTSPHQSHYKNIQEKLFKLKKYLN